MSAKREKECRRAERVCKAAALEAKEQADRASKLVGLCLDVSKNCLDTLTAQRKALEATEELTRDNVVQAVEDVVKPYRMELAVQWVLIVLLALDRILSAVLGG